ncbi:MAG: adenosine deaminase [Chloroflexia bacterium]
MRIIKATEIPSTADQSLPDRPAARLPDFIRAMPKVELHVHLEGAIAPETLLTLARRNGVDLPVTDEAGMREWFAFRDFAHFVDIYVAITRCLKRVEDYELIAYEFGASMARQNIRYAEVTFSPSTHRLLGVPQEVWWRGLLAGRQRALDEFGVRFNWVFDIVRFPIELVDRHDRADYTTAVAIECMNDGVVGIGLGGTEAGAPPEPFAPWFDRARAAGLRSVPHAGETVGPESIWGSLRALGAERIGHGVRCIEDPALVAELRERQIPLEVSPTSNVCLGVAPSLAGHQLPQLLAEGLYVTLNSDDPPMFNTTLTDEYLRCAATFGWGTDEIGALALNSVRAALLPDAERAAMERAFRAEFAALRTMP